MNDKQMVNSAIASLGPIVKLSDRENTDKTYAIAAGYLKDLIKDVSAELTDEQRHCPYCHFKKDFYNQETTKELNSDSNDPSINIDPSMMELIFDMDDSYNIDLQGNVVVGIEYCPKCG
ncbi:hypothetical protein, partial [Fructilactobacillus florum]|uniref:hypothetical protein n=1 Tax=Fructilactobacillus florum TaxID=640331 RepID=UPI0012E7F824